MLKALKNKSENKFTFGKYKGCDINNIRNLRYLEYILEEIYFDSSDSTTNVFVQNLEIRIAELREL